MELIMDACSAILLAKASVLETILGTHTISFTKEVQEEVLKGKQKKFPDALLFEKLQQEGKTHDVPTPKQGTDKLMRDFGMDRGEASTIAAAISTGASVVTDNKQGRTATKIHGVELFGSIELIVSLRKKGIIHKEKAHDALETLRTEGWFDSSILNEAMEELK